MRIAILTTVHSALDGRIFHKQAVSLAQAGYDVTLLAPLDTDAEALARQHGIAYVPLRASGRRIDRLLQWLRLMRLVRRNRYDVWHFHDPELLPLAIAWRWLFARQVHLIYDVHEDVPKDILSKVWIPSYLRKPVARLAYEVERWGMRNCQLVVAAGDSIVERVTASARRSIVVRNYPLMRQETSVLRSSTNGRPVRVIYPGTLTEVRGIRDVVQAMDELHDCAVELWLMGRFYPAAFEREIRHIAGSNVVIHPQVPFDQVPQYIQSSDIGVVCFHPTPAELGTLPVKMFEYMQAGLPVVASDFPVWRGIIESAGCGLLVAPGPGSSQQIAAAIRHLVNDSHLRQRMGQAGIRAVREKYSWQNEVVALIAEYDRIEGTLGLKSTR
jgi:glycosyltransferase involved in cell wall biosynthesis